VANNPNAALIGKLDYLWTWTGLPIPAGGFFVNFSLCGYGSQIPRVAGEALFGSVTSQDIATNTEPYPGQFQLEVYSNDLIIPAGTYYVLTVKDNNGDVIQCNAYRFIGGGTFDLTIYPPYDPNQPPPPLPPLITNLLAIVEPSNDMVFDGSTYTAFQTTLPGGVGDPEMQSMVPGNLYTFIIIQDGVGGHDFLWSANVYNAAYVNHAPNGRLIQTFVADNDGSLWAISAGTYWP